MIRKILQLFSFKRKETMVDCMLNMAKDRMTLFTYASQLRERLQNANAKLYMANIDAENMPPMPDIFMDIKAQRREFTNISVLHYGEKRNDK